MNAFYFITTIMTTIGYDVPIDGGMDNAEYLYLMFLMFFGIAMFTHISRLVLSFRHEGTYTVNDLVATNKENAIDFLFRLSLAKHDKSLPAEVYDECENVIE